MHKTIEMGAGIFRITNKVTGRIFLGQSRNVYERLEDYKKLRPEISSQTNIFLSLLEYGPEGHNFEILKEFSSAQPSTAELRELLSKYISRYRKKHTLMNSADGRGGSGQWSEQRKKLLSDAKKGRGFRGRAPIIQYSENGKFIKEWESISKVSEDLKINYNLLIKTLRSESGLIGGYQWRYNKNSPSFKQKLQYGQIDENGKMVKLYDKEQLIAAGFSPLNVYYAAKAGHKSSGFYWSQFGQTKFIAGVHPNIKPYITRSDYAAIPVLQYSLDGQFIREWDSATEAAAKYGFSITTIREQIRQNNKPNKNSNDFFHYQWANKTEDYPKKIEVAKLPYVAQYNEQGVLVSVYTSTKAAAKQSKVATARQIKIAMYSKKFKYGFFWEKYFGYIGDVPTLRIEVKKVEPNIETVERVKTPVLQYGVNGVFIKRWDDISEASIAINRDKTSIRYACLGKLKKVGMYQWRFPKGNLIPNKIAAIVYKTANYVYVSKDDNSVISLIPPVNQIKLSDLQKVYIIQFDQNGRYIKTWKSVSDIKKELDLTIVSIRNTCSGKQKMSGGFIWRYGEKRD